VIQTCLDIALPTRKTVSGTGYGEAEYIVDSGHSYVTVTNYSGQHPTGAYATYAVVYSDAGMTGPQGKRFTCKSLGAGERP
jgi:hypothetical protein